jgi:flavin reductase (DIM6/NTAB) family NADH-FMN oxidoreductase RutF
MKQSLGAKPLVYPTPVFVVGTYDAQNRPNVMTAAWGGIGCSRPLSVAVSLRQTTLSYGNLIARKAFTISIPSEAHVKAVDYIGMTSGRDGDKFAAAKLTPVRSSLVDAPYVQEFPLVIECKLAQTIELGSHTLFVGEVVDVKVEESARLGAHGTADIKQIRPLLFMPDTQAYYGLGIFIARAFSVGEKI